MDRSNKQYSRGNPPNNTQDDRSERLEALPTKDPRAGVDRGSDPAPNRIWDIDPVRLKQLGLNPEAAIFQCGEGRVETAENTGRAREHALPFGYEDRDYVSEKHLGGRCQTTTLSNATIPQQQTATQQQIIDSTGTHNTLSPQMQVQGLSRQLEVNSPPLARLPQDHSLPSRDLIDKAHEYFQYSEAQSYLQMLLLEQRKNNNSREHPVFSRQRPVNSRQRPVYPRHHPVNPRSHAFALSRQEQGYLGRQKNASYPPNQVFSAPGVINAPTHGPKPQQQAAVQRLVNLTSPAHLNSAMHSHHHHQQPMQTFHQQWVSMQVSVVNMPVVPSSQQTVNTAQPYGVPGGLVNVMAGYAANTRGGYGSGYHVNLSIQQQAAANASRGVFNMNEGAYAYGQYQQQASSNAPRGVDIIEGFGLQSLTNMPNGHGAVSGLTGSYNALPYAGDIARIRAISPLYADPRNMDHQPPTGPRSERQPPTGPRNMHMDHRPRPGHRDIERAPPYVVGMGATMRSHSHGRGSQPRGSVRMELGEIQDGHATQLLAGEALQTLSGKHPPSASSAQISPSRPIIVYSTPPCDSRFVILITNYTLW